jgi:hypothetical protein
VSWKDVKITIECGTERVIAKVVDYCVCSVPIQLYHPLLSGVYCILVPQLEDHVGIGNRVLVEFWKTIAIVVGGSRVNGPDPKPQVH